MWKILIALLIFALPAAADYSGPPNPQLLTSTRASGSALSMSAGIALSMATVTLTPGTWDVSGSVGTNPNAATLTTAVIASISTTDGVQATSPGGGLSQVSSGANAGFANVVTTGITRITVTVNTPVYIVGTAFFSVNTLTAYGTIRAQSVP